MSQQEMEYIEELSKQYPFNYYTIKELYYCFNKDKEKNRNMPKIYASYES